MQDPVIKVNDEILDLPHEVIQGTFQTLEADILSMRLSQHTAFHPNLISDQDDPSDFLA